MEKYCYREFEKPIRAYEKHCPLRVWYILTPIIPVMPIFRIFYLGSFYFLLCAHERSHDHKFAKMRSLLKSWREQRLVYLALTVCQRVFFMLLPTCWPSVVSNMLANCRVVTYANLYQVCKQDYVKSRSVTWLTCDLVGLKLCLACRLPSSNTYPEKVSVSSSELTEFSMAAISLLG